MALLLLSIAWVLIVAGLLFHAINQYRQYEIVRPTAPAVVAFAPAMTVIVPARDEENNITRCVQAIRDQDYPASQLRIIVVDDNSRDSTARLVQELARSDDRIRLMDAGPLPQGWLGKPHACWRGATQASGEWLCFVDADTVGQPPLMRTAMSIATARHLDLLSLQPFQELGSAWERLLMPCGFFIIAFTQDLHSTNDPASPEAAVNGQFLLVRRAAYDRAGGHAAVRNAVAEDSALARAFKAAGCRIALCGTENLLHTRMYTTPRALLEGLARQAQTLLSRAPLSLVALIGLVLAWSALALPAWALRDAVTFPDDRAVAALVLASLGSLALFGTHIGAARYFRIQWGYGFLFPLGYTLGAGVLMFAAWQRHKGQSRWKGRVFQAGDGDSPTASPPYRSDVSPQI